VLKFIVSRKHSRTEMLSICVSVDFAADKMMALNDICVVMKTFHSLLCQFICLQCFDTVGWAGHPAYKNGGMVDVGTG